MKTRALSWSPRTFYNEATQHKLELCNDLKKDKNVIQFEILLISITYLWATLSPANEQFWKLQYVEPNIEIKSHGNAKLLTGCDMSGRFKGITY